MSIHVPISKKIVLVNSISAVLHRVLSLTVLVWLQQYLLNQVSRSEFKLYALVGSLILFVPLLVFVLSAGLGRFVTEAYARGDERRVTQITSTIAPMFAGVALLMLLLGGLAAWHIDHLLTIAPELVPDARLMFGILVLTAAARVVVMPFSVWVHVRQKFVWNHVTLLIGELIWIAVLFALLFGDRPRVLWVPVATLPQVAFNLTVTCLLSRKFLPAARFRWSEMRRGIVGPLLSFGGWTTVGRVMSVTREAGSVLLLSELPAGRTVAAQETEVNAMRLGALVESKLFPAALVPLTTTLPVFTAMHATGQADRLRRAYFRVARYVLWTFLFMAVPLIVFRDELWKLYITDEYERYSAAALVMALFLLKAPVDFMHPVLTQLASAKNRMRPMALSVVVVEGITTLAIIVAILALKAGAVGVAAVTLGVHTVLSPLLYWRLGLQLAGATFGDWLRHTMGPGLLPAVLAAPVYIGLRALTVPDTWFELGALVAVGCAFYVAVVYLFCMRPDERRDVAAALGKLRALRPGRRSTGP